MFNMTKLREHSNIILWLLLIFFVLSMVAGGLLGGANIVDLFFGGTNPDRYAGWVNNSGVTHQTFQNQYNNQLSLFRQQNVTIDSRTRQTASNNAWNLIVEDEFKNQKIEELTLIAQPNEIYEFLLNSPPRAFQQLFISNGFFIDDENKFVLSDYQEAVKNQELPEELYTTYAYWEAYLKNYLGNIKLLNLYNKASTVSNQEIKFEYLKNNINCNIDYIFINTNDILDSEINITDEEIENIYNENKENEYQKPEIRIVEYVSWEIPNEIKADTLNFTFYVDSLNNEALIFADESDITSFKDAVTKLNYNLDTLEIHEDFNNNSGFPFIMGASRTGVRFAFDNSIGTVSDPIQMDNQIIVMNITGENSSEYKKLSEVSNSIKNNLIREKKKEYAINILNAKLNYGDTNWDIIAEEDTIINVLSEQTGLIGGSFKDIGKSSEMTGALLALEENQTSQIISTYNTVCKIKINSKDKFVQEQYNEAYSNIKNQLTAAKNNSNYRTWLNDIKTNSTVNDYRSKTY